MNYCDLCFRDAKYLGELFPSHDLLLVGNIYMAVDGHDEIFRFQGKPVKDPCEGLSEEEANKILASQMGLDADRDYTNFVEEFRLKQFTFHPQLGHRIVELCKQAGYNPDRDGWIEYWIVHKAALLVDSKI